MADYRRPVEFGANADPLAANPRLPPEVARVADAAGLELVGVRDDPYNRAFLDTWTLSAATTHASARLGA